MFQDPFSMFGGSGFNHPMLTDGRNRQRDNGNTRNELAQRRPSPFGFGSMFGEDMFGHVNSMMANMNNMMSNMRSQFVSAEKLAYMCIHVICMNLQVLNILSCPTYHHMLLNYVKCFFRWVVGIYMCIDGLENCSETFFLVTGVSFFVIFDVCVLICTSNLILISILCQLQMCVLGSA